MPGLPICFNIGFTSLIFVSLKIYTVCIASIAWVVSAVVYNPFSLMSHVLKEHAVKSNIKTNNIKFLKSVFLILKSHNYEFPNKIHCSKKHHCSQ